MAIVKKKTQNVPVEVKSIDKLDRAVAQGRQVRNFLTGLLTDLESANALSP